MADNANNNIHNIGAAAAADRNNNDAAAAQRIGHDDEEIHRHRGRLDVNDDDNINNAVARDANGRMGGLNVDAVANGGHLNNNNVVEDNAEVFAHGDLPLQGGEGGVIDGGVAGVLEATSERGNEIDAEAVARKTKSTDCELIILIECREEIQQSPTSIGSRVGSTVSIGLFEKTTKLDALFHQYVTFCSRKSDPLTLDDVEFVHHEVLTGGETAEGCALMKNDRIYARRRRTKDRSDAEIQKKFQRDSDREYLKQLRTLYAESVNASSSGNGAFALHAGGPNVLLECRPYLEVGQRGVLSHFIKTHYCIVEKRCPWLSRKIKKATDIQREILRNAGQEEGVDGSFVNRIPIGDREASNGSPTSAFAGTRQGNPISDQPRDGGALRRDGGDIARGVSRNDDDDDSVVHYDPMERSRNHHNQFMADGPNQAEVRAHLHGNAQAFQFDGQHQLVAADDDDASGSAGSILLERGGSPVLSGDATGNRLSGLGDLVLVDLTDHPPEAVKLLLEYCYTNRVVCLGKDAFFQASNGAVSPHSSAKWPNHGNPTVSMAAALAGISLGEVSGMERLSLMCEIAASNLVSNTNVLDALAHCTDQASKTGNRLSILRKKAMAHLISVPVLKELGKARRFLVSLQERRDLVVPALLQGAAQDIALPPQGKRKQASSQSQYDKVDEDDKEARNLERLKRRTERQLARSGSGIAPFVWPTF